MEGMERGIRRIVEGAMLATVCVCIGGSAAGAELKVPDDFLMRKGSMPKVLEVPVSGTFKMTPVEDVLGALCSPLRVSNSFGRPAGGPEVPPFTGQFQDVPLRRALFELAQQCRLTMELVVLEEHGHWFIAVRPRVVGK
jgi:hypothetical protein